MLAENINLEEVINSSDPIPKLFELLDNPMNSNKSGTQEAILFLLESKHQWEEVRKHALKWRRIKWVAAFISRMRKRVGEPE